MAKSAAAKNDLKGGLHVHLPINCYLWRFCGLILSFLWLCVGSSKFFARPLKRIALVSSLPEVPCSPPKFRVKILSSYSPPKKKFPYAWILFFIYKATHSLWNILFPFFPTCAWIWEAHYVWFTWRFPQGCSRILFGK